MRTAVKSIVAPLVVLALVLSVSPAVTLAGSTNGARLEGLVLDLDGRPANGFAVHLIDGQGASLERSATNDDGQYSFSGLESGRYSLGIESPQGQMAPVASAPIKLGNDELARRDLKLLEADPSQVNSTLAANYGLGQWFGSLTTAAKAWTIIAIVAVVGITAAALSDDNETNASPTTESVAGATQSPE